MAKGNDHRIPFAEWLYRMSEADVPYQARALAVYATVFKITTDADLARLSGMDTKGIADKTYNKWKSYLCVNGWVIVKQVKVGRTRTTEVYPALRDQPVTFTDIRPKDARKFYGEETVETTGDDRKSYGDTPVESTSGKVEVTGELAQDAHAHVPAPAGDITTRATKESSSRIVTSEELASKLASSMPDEIETTTEVVGLNGAAGPMLADIRGWLGSGGDANARQWLSTFVLMHGEEVVKASYLKLKSDILSGSLISKPIQTWSTIATRIKRDPPKTGKPERGISRLKEKFLRAGE